MFQAGGNLRFVCSPNSSMLTNKKPILVRKKIIHTSTPVKLKQPLKVIFTTLKMFTDKVLYETLNSFQIKISSYKFESEVYPRRYEVNIIPMVW